MALRRWDHQRCVHRPRAPPQLQEHALRRSQPHWRFWRHPPAPRTFRAVRPSDQSAPMDQSALLQDCCSQLSCSVYGGCKSHPSREGSHTPAQPYCSWCALQQGSRDAAGAVVAQRRLHQHRTPTASPRYTAAMERTHHRRRRRSRSRFNSRWKTMADDGREVCGRCFLGRQFFLCFG
jgi:hypothetical protein